GELFEATPRPQRTNAAPTIDALGPMTAPVGSPFTVRGTFHDDDAATASAATGTADDGTNGADAAPTPMIVSGHPWMFGARYTAPGTYHPPIPICDDEGACSQARITVQAAASNLPVASVGDATIPGNHGELLGAQRLLFPVTLDRPAAAATKITYE